MNENEWKPNETWQDALSRSKEIRGPADVKPVKWSCNPERKWVHITESEWIGLHEAFHAMHQRLMALQDSSSTLHYEMSQVLETKDPTLIDLQTWITCLEEGQRGVWPPINRLETDTP